MTGLGAIPSSSGGGRSRWVGRADILPTRPDAPQWLRFLVLTVQLLGLQLVWSCEMSQASPFLLSLGVSKSMMSVVFLAGPLSGLIVQPLVGHFSDQCKSRLGRRRPFIIAGCCVTSLAVMMLGWSREIASVCAEEGGSLHQHLAIACAVIAVYLIDFAVNVVQAMDRALLVDVVAPSLQPDANAWASRMFGFGAVFGYWVGGIDLVWLTRGWLGSEQLKVLTFFTSFFLLVTHTITCTCVTERILISRDDEHEKGGGAMAALEDIWQTIKTLPRPIRQVFNVQFTSWIGWFPVLFFSTTWVAETYLRASSDPSADLASAPASVREAATRAGTKAMLWHSVVSLVTSILIPPLVDSGDGKTNDGRGRYRSRGGGHPQWEQVKRYLPSLPFTWLSLPLLWTLSNFLFASLLFSTWFASSVAGATVVLATMGFAWSITNWAPFAILGELILRLGSSPSTNLSHLSSPGGSHLMLHDRSSGEYDPDLDSREHIALSTIAEEASDYSAGEAGSRRTSSSTPARKGVYDRAGTASPSPSPLATNSRQAPPSRLDFSSASPCSGASSPAFTLGSANDEVPFTPTTATSNYFDASSSPSYPGSSRAESFASASVGGGSGGSNTPTLTDSPSSRANLDSPRGGGRERQDSTASSTFAYPPNHGSTGLDLLGDPFSSADSGADVARGPGHAGEFFGADPYAYRPHDLAGGGGSSSTVHLPVYAGGAAGGGRRGSGSPDEHGSVGGTPHQVLQIRHSDSFDLSASERASFDSQRSSLDLRSGEAARKLATPSTVRAGGSGGFDRRSTPRIMVGGEEEGEETEEWDGLDEGDEGRLRREGRDLAGEGGEGGGGGDQTGVILGCHNIFLVLPQFLVSAISSLIFALLAPHHSVIGHAGSHSGAGVKTPHPGLSLNSTLSAAAGGADEAAFGASLDRLGAGEDDEYRSARMVVRALARVGEAFVAVRRQETEEGGADDSGEGGGWDALGLIFRLGGVSALFSTYIAYRMWRDRQRAIERQRAVGRGYRLG
ncbi:hypothetical protein JCM11251_004876 [Rhodosporidiobolus azoricus]